MKTVHRLPWFVSILAVLALACGGGGGGGGSSDAGAVVLDQAALEIGYAPGDSAAGVTQSLVLATAGSHGSAIAWATDSEPVVNAAGAVARPDYLLGDASVVLTATLAKGQSVAHKAYTVRVLKAARRHVTFIVEVPAGTPADATICMPNSGSGWDPAAPAGLASGPAQYQFILEKGLPGTTLEYKYTRGSWTTVEKDADGFELLNRAYRFTDQDDVVHDRVASWAAP